MDHVAEDIMGKTGIVLKKIASTMANVLETALGDRCPNCGSREVKETISSTIQSTLNPSTKKRYRCKKCGYEWEGF